MPLDSPEQFSGLGELAVAIARIDSKVDGLSQIMAKETEGLRRYIEQELKNVTQSITFGDSQNQQAISFVQGHIDRNATKIADLEANAKRLWVAVGETQEELSKWKNRVVGIGLGMLITGGGISAALIKVLS